MKTHKRPKYLEFNFEEIHFQAVPKAKLSWLNWRQVLLFVKFSAKQIRTDPSVLAYFHLFDRAESDLNWKTEHDV